MRNRSQHGHCLNVVSCAGVLADQRFAKKSVNGIRFSYRYLSLCFYEYLKTFSYKIKNFQVKRLYVKRHRFSIFVVADRYYYCQYSKTYTLCSGLNSVLFVWVRKKIRRNIYKKKGWQHEHFLNAFFTNSQRLVVDCLTVAAGILARSEGVIKGTGANRRFVKNAFKNAELPPFFL